MTGPFTASKVKLARAARHIDEADHANASLIVNPILKVVTRQNPDDPNLIDVVAHITGPIPGDFSAIVGDAIHNLRAALDLMACDLVRLNKGNPKDVYFPFAKVPADLDQQIKARNFDRAAADVVDMVRALKPYVGGNAALRAIHDLDICDKHQLLIPVVESAMLPALELDFVNGVYFRLPDNVPHTMPIADGALLFSMPHGEGTGVGAQLGAIPTLAFGANTPFPLEPIFPRLKELAELVDGIVQTFEAHCL